jgi:hypothetical protein
MTRRLEVAVKLYGRDELSGYILTMATWCGDLYRIDIDRNAEVLLITRG